MNCLSALASAWIMVLVCANTPAEARIPNLTHSKSNLVYRTFESYANDNNHTTFKLQDASRFVIHTSWPEDEGGPAYQTTYTGSYREAENVFDLTFESYCINQSCQKTTPELLQQLFEHSTDAWAIRDTDNVYRISKNPRMLYINGVHMRPDLPLNRLIDRWFGN